MARYWMTGAALGPSGDPNFYELVGQVAYIGEDVPEIPQAQQQGLMVSRPGFLGISINVSIGVDWTGTQIRDRVIDLIVDTAASNGFAVARAGGLIPQYVRGQ